MARAISNKLPTTLLLIAALGSAVPADGQQPAQAVSEQVADSASEAAQAAPPAPVVLRDDTLFSIYGRIGPFSAADRARAIAGRLDDMVRNPDLDATDISVTEDAGAYDIAAGDLMIMTVTAEDAAGAGRPLDLLARDYATSIEVALAREIEAFSLTSLLIGAGYTVLATVALLLILRLLRRAFPAAHRYLDRRFAGVKGGGRFGEIERVASERAAQILHGLLRLVRIALTLLLLYLYLPLVLSFFPWTRRLSGEIVGWVTRPLAQVGAALIDYLPSFFTILVIVAVTYYGIKLIKQFFLAIETGSIELPGFYRDWANPTYKLVRFLVIALAVVVIWPFLPNSDSPAFGGVAAFLGLLITFGSAGTISNVVGGVMLTYMRAFKPGDRVKIADTVGDVIGQDLFVTRIRTIKNVDITIPNSLVLGAHIINWSAIAAQEGVVLHTTVTIGYDVPWRRVHEMLLDAAKRTEGLLEAPAPFVLQTALNDFYVSYELNAYTHEPSRMARLYSELHQHIQDCFAEAGVEIMSPHYSALRDGHDPALPDAPAGRTGGFRIRREDDART